MAFIFKMQNVIKEQKLPNRMLLLFIQNDIS